MVKHLFIFIFCCSCYIQAQFAIVNDKDGFVNVREQQNTTSEILTKMKNGSVVAIDQEPNKTNWILVNYDKEAEGYIFHDRLKDVKSFEIVLPNQLTINSVNFETKEYRIEIETEGFNKKKHTITKEEDIIYAIDGLEFYGTDGMEPLKEIKSFKIYYKGNLVEIPKEFYSNLYNIDIKDFRLTYNLKLNQYYLFGTFGDGAATFDAIWVLENGKIVQQIAQVNFYA